MSVVGTAVAAAVAQSAVQAQQVAQKRDKENTQSNSEATRLQDLLQTHLRLREESGQAENPPLRVEEQLPKHHVPQEQPSEEQEGEEQLEPDTNFSDAPQPPTYSPSRRNSTLYRHLDVQA